MLLINDNRMKRHTRNIGMDRLVLALILLLISSVRQAHAYIDPGSGSLIVQMIVAGVVGALFYFRKALNSFFSLFRRKDKNDRHSNQN